ncbi:MAG: hydantoinase/oxoprolinase family protein [Candidatus Thorarchaeota archaeon]|nr:hydantoinase/oxoprolinase family protein [Candidatus Thorarchaeota archaeon]
MFIMRMIGVDVGGTFTDVIMVDSKTGIEYVHKVPSTPESQDKAVTKGVTEILEMNYINSQSIELVVHGTTVATNAMLERKGAKVVLLTTEGLEDVLEIGRQNRDDIYSLRAERAEPLVDRTNRIGVHERLNSEGKALIELTDATISSVISKATASQPDSIAVSLLFSYQNQEHERRLLKAINASSEVYAVASSNILPEFREFERTSTTVLEAYLGPLVAGYLQRLDTSLSSICPKSRLTVMQSNGGTMLASRAKGQTIGLAISGLASGAIGGWEYAKQWSIPRAITLDMGGTSCDISAIMGNVVVKPDNEVGGLPLRVPSVDVKTIGAGGGSIAWIDTASVLHVGPQSAGAFPGPAAYGKGGKDATVTDANLVLGRLNPEFFLGGNVPLDLDSAHESISKISSCLDLTNEETALGIIRISTANMVNAIREVTLERGSDPRKFTLIPFGGAGPTQAIDIAEALGINEVLVPPYPGITSALGLVCTDLRVDVMKTVLLVDDARNEETLLSTFSALENEAAERLIRQGASRKEIRLKWKIDMRYVGQSHELNIDIPEEGTNIVERSKSEFERAHHESFGYIMSNREIEWVTARVVAKSESGEFRPIKHRVNVTSEPIGQRRVLLADGTWMMADVYRRWDLAAKQEIVGPAIIEQLDTTTYVTPDWNATQENDGVLWLRRDER